MGGAVRAGAADRRVPVGSDAGARPFEAPARHHRRHARLDRAARLRPPATSDEVSDREYTLFHRVAEPASARIRSRVVDLGLKPRIDFQNAETDGKDELVRLGGDATPALWDGHTLTVGESEIARMLLKLRPEPGPEREDGW